MSDGRYVPRTIFVDTDPTTIEEARYDLLRSLFNPLCFFNGKEEAASNYARGRFILGAELIEPIINRIRQEVEATDNCQGFIVNHSIGGGTGSGLTVRIMEHLTNEYRKAISIQFPIFPSEYLSTTVVDPYNAVLHCGFNVPNSNMTVMMDNSAIMGLLSRHLQIEKPTVVFLNRLIAQIQSNFFCGFHYNGDPICSTMEEVTTNLIPFPELHYIYVRHAPIVAARRHDYQTHNNPPEDIVKAALKPQFNTLSADRKVSVLQVL
ncbi:Tubulin alpha-2 chain [Taenia crassiceps]|uniref:Tubulin alpha-2 chain n=1 Tax=Taenia crassiceps TaxID=6207 RepID=A0ABR4QD10_9CEST